MSFSFSYLLLPVLQNDQGIGQVFAVQRLQDVVLAAGRLESSVRRILSKDTNLVDGVTRSLRQIAFEENLCCLNLCVCINRHSSPFSSLASYNLWVLKKARHFHPSCETCKTKVT